MRTSLSIEAGKSSRRPAVKQEHIVSELRRRVVEGLLAPGVQLATRRELEVEFGASLHTVQKALDELARDGFVYARGSRGTFVAERPPHLSHYGLVFSQYPGQPSFNRAWMAMTAEAVNFERSLGIKLPTYYGIDGHTDTEDYQRLISDIRSHRLAGIIFTSSPFQLVGTPLLEEPGIPRVAIMKPGSHGELPAITFDNAMFARRAIEYFVSRGRQKLAILAVAEISAQRAISAASEHHFVTHPYWTQFVNHTAPEFARNSVHLLMHNGQAERPDAFLIADDNLVEYATAGLVAAGVRIPEDLEVVAHCNFPWPTPSGIPVRRLGYDTREVLRRCLDAINQQRSGVKNLKIDPIPAVFEDEVQ